MSKKKLLIAIVSVLTLTLIIVTIKINGNGQKAVEVQTAKVDRQTIVQTVNATGRIQPKTQVKISADVSAKIKRLGVKEGDWVEKGEFLFQLERERYLATVESSQANLNSTRANAKLAKENMLKAEKDYIRSKELFDKNLESQASLDAMAAAFEVEKARFESAMDQVERSAASLKQTQDDLSKTTIYAPMSGTISKLNKEQGEMALGSQFQEDVIMVISNLSGMEAQVDVDENDVVNIAIGDSAKIEVDAFPDILLDGVVSEIANSASISGEGSADQKTEFEVKISIVGVFGEKGSAISTSNKEIKVASASAKLRPGMTASSDIITEIRANALCVPIQSVAVRTVEQLEPKIPTGNGNAIADESKKESNYKPDKDGFVEVVFVVTDGLVEGKQVKTGIQSETHIEIVEGLNESDVIVTGNYRALSKDLQNGTKIIIGDKE